MNAIVLYEAMDTKPAVLCDNAVVLNPFEMWQCIKDVY